MGSVAIVLGADTLANLQQLMDWAAQFALWLCLGAMLCGAGVLGAAQAFGSGSSGPRNLILSAVTGVMVLGIAGAVVTLFSNSFGAPK
jgi:hypothetical protein